MEYLCILNAFERNYYNRMKEIERLTTAAAAAATLTHQSQPQEPRSAISTAYSSPSASLCTTSNASSSPASSASSSPTSQPPQPQPQQLTGDKRVKEATATAALQPHHFPALAHATALAATHQQLHQHFSGAATAYQQPELPVQSSLFYQGQSNSHSHSQSPPQQAHQLAQQQQQQHNSNMANSLLWQPWRDLQQAAAIHHQLYKQQQKQQIQLKKETRLTPKELPTTKWRRERRQRAAEYQVHDAGTANGSCSGSMSNEIDDRDMDSPIDMSVTSSSLKHHRSSPPPPYREPLPGANFATTRPSVITQAPPKREPKEHTSREYDNRSTESVSMCDIDEHFRRSLGPDYAALFSKKSPTPSSPTPSPQPATAVNGVCTGAATNVTAMKSSESSPNTMQLHAIVSTYQQHLQPQHGAVRHAELPPPQEEPLSLHRAQTPETPPPPPPTQAKQTSASTPTVPAIIRVKAEPGLAIASPAQTPPASPTSSTNTSMFTKTVASVDDHFAKALGDTWKKLQGQKE